MPSGAVRVPRPGGLELVLREDLGALLVGPAGEAVVAAVVANSVRADHGAAPGAMGWGHEAERVVRPADPGAVVRVAALGVGHDGSSAGRQEARDASPALRGCQRGGVNAGVSTRGVDAGCRRGWSARPQLGRDVREDLLEGLGHTRRGESLALGPVRATAAPPAEDPR